MTNIKNLIMDMDENATTDDSFIDSDSEPGSDSFSDDDSFSDNDDVNEDTDNEDEDNEHNEDDDAQALSEAIAITKDIKPCENNNGKRRSTRQRRPVRTYQSEFWGNTERKLLMDGISEEQLKREYIEAPDMDIVSDESDGD